jgi:hypothetical protein
MKRVLVPLLAAAVAGPAAAADWPMLSGSEEGRPEVAMEPYGYLQILAESTPLAAPVTGLKSPELEHLNGEHHALNEETPVTMSLRRARLGLRGTIPHTEGRLTWRFSLEAGQNDITRDRGITLVDASVSVKVVPGLRLRLGQFKLPLMDETSESIPQTGAMAALSPAALLLLEQPIDEGRFVGQAFGFRDVGVQAFDSFHIDHVELAYALMGSQGRFNAIDHDGRYDVTGRVQLAWLKDPAHPYNPRRDEVALALWSQHGEREVDDTFHPRVREGLALHAHGLHTRSRLEVVHAAGMILLDPEYPFVGQPVRLVEDGEAWAFTAQFTAEPVHGIDLTAQLSELHRQPGERDEEVMRDVVVGVEWWPAEKVRLQLEYDARAVLLPETATADQKTIANAVADIVLAQLTVML